MNDKNHWRLSALILTLSLTALVQTAVADPGRATPCSQTADTLRTACLFDSHDDLLETRANCDNLASASERAACRADARDEWREARGECSAVRRARLDACQLLGEQRYDVDPLTDAGIEFIDPDDVPSVYPVNPYVSVEAGHTYVLRAGEDGEETVVVHVTGDTREIQGVACRVVIDAVVELEHDGADVDIAAVEVTDDWFAQSAAGDVYYCGEISRNFEDGVLRDLDGSFEAGRDFAKAGVLIRALPAAGVAHRQEFALAEAEDIVQYRSTASGPTPEEGGDNPAFPCNGGCLKTYEFTPLEPDGAEFKYYLPGTGFVLAVALEDGEVTGEREELVCVGDGLDILEQPACGLDDPGAVREALCLQSPVYLCDDAD